MQDDGSPGHARVIVVTLVVAAVWGLLAILRPMVTYHLGPAVVAWAYPFVRWTRPARPSTGRALSSAAAGGLFAATATLVLHAAGFLRGPALFGGGPLGEGLIVAAVAALVAAVAGIAVSAVKPGS